MTFSRAMAAGLLLNSVFTLAVAAVCAVCYLILGNHWVWPVGVAVWAVLCFAYTPAFCRRFTGEFDGTVVRTHSGVLWHRQTVVPLSSLRTFEVWAPPLHRFFGCRTIILRFAGGCAWLPLIGEKSACRLIRLLENRNGSVR